MTTKELTQDDWAGERGDKWLAHIAGMEAMLEPVDAPLIAELALDTPVRVADIGCGGGRTSVKLLEAAPPGSSVLGFDISPALIETAQSRFRSREPAPGFTVMDVAGRIPDGRFDRLASRFGVMFFGDPSAAFTRLVDWLVPGGRFAFAVWAEKEQNPWMLEIKRVIEQFVDVPRVDPDGPGPFRYADFEKFAALLRHSGFEQIRSNDWRGKLPIGGNLSPLEAAKFAISSFSSFVNLLEGAGPAALEIAERDLSERFRSFYRDGAVFMDASVHIVSGIRPACS